MITILDNWKIAIGGRRRGANITVQNGDRDISGTVTGWLNGDGLDCRRAFAKFVVVRRWSYGIDTMDVPGTFAVSVESNK
jgi:hypothetical protein